MKFHTKYSPPVSPAVDFSNDPGLTDQSQKDDCDINRIIAKYRETGYLVDPMHPGTRQPLFGDFTDVGDYQSALEIINRADELFMQLPAKVRDRFSNNPQELLDFIQDENNRDEAIQLGLIPPPEKPVETPVDSKTDDDK